MSSIEDILNADDSDDDEGVDIHNIDLELLLHSRDDDIDIDCLIFDDVPVEAPPLREISGEIKCEALVAASSAATLNEALEASYAEEEGRSTHRREDPQDDMDYDFEYADIVEQDGAQDDQLVQSSLVKADIREQRFLKSGGRDVVSALQVKRCSSVLINHSNVKFEELLAVSDQLNRNAKYKQHGPGAATSMFVNAQFIAIGTVKGLIIIFDHSQEIRQVLGSASSPTQSRPATAVTSLVASINKGGRGGAAGTLLLCGYASGEIALWDMAKGVIVKLIDDLHMASVDVVSVVEHLQDGLVAQARADTSGDEVSLPADLNDAEHAQAQQSSDYSTSSLQSFSMTIVSADCQGVMYKTRLSKTLWSSVYTSESDCLLDESSGALLGYASLPSLISSMRLNSPPALRSKRHAQPKVLPCRYISALLQQKQECSAQLLAITVAAHTWLVQAHPAVRVVHKWAAPSGHGQTLSGALGPAMDWAWICDSSDSADQTSDGQGDSGQERSEGEGEAGSDWVPALARGWGPHVQVLLVTTARCAAPITAEVDRPVSSFGFLGSPMSSSGAVSSNSYQTGFAMRYGTVLPQQSVVALKWISSTQLAVLTNTNVIIMNQCLVQLECFALPPAFALAVQQRHDGQDGVPGSARGCFPLQSNIVNGQQYLHVADTVVRIQVQSCFDLADHLINVGQWLEALAVVLENIKKAPSLLSANAQEVDKYILTYAELAVKQPTIASRAAASTTVQQNRNHYHLVSGVCMEYCIACRRLELLFADIYRIFKVAQQHAVFLESLEPFILSQEINSLPPMIIAEFCEMALHANRLPSIERCVAYFDVANLDMNFLTKFLHQNKMHSSFLYVYSNGLGDFPEAFQVIFNSILDEGAEDGSAVQSAEEDALEVESKLYLNPEQSDVGYKLLLFLSYTFEGRVFPRGDAVASITESTSWGLLKICTERHFLPFPTLFAVTGSLDLKHISKRLGEYPYLILLCKVDAEALIQVLHKGVTAMQLYASSSPIAHERLRVTDQLAFISDASSTAFGPHHIAAEIPSVYWNVLSFCTRADAELFSDLRMTTLFLDSFLDLIAACPGQLPRRFLNELVAFGSSRAYDTRRLYEESFQKLAERQMRVSHDLAGLQSILLQHNFWLAGLTLRKCGAKEHSKLESDVDKALEFYISIASDEHALENKVEALAFAYIRAEFAHISSSAASEVEQQRDRFCKKVAHVLPQLCQIDVERTKAVVCSHLQERVGQIVDSTMMNLSVQFTLLDALVSKHGVAAENGTSLTSVFSSHLLTYFQLLCTFEPGRVLKFLHRHENSYALEECLSICRQRGLSEAVSFLMERTGAVMEALQILLKEFSQKLKQVRRDIDATLRKEMASHAITSKSATRSSSAPGESERGQISRILSLQGTERADATTALSVFKTLEGTISCAADLCGRNSDPGQDGLWLAAFDHLLLERQTIRTGTMSSSGEIIVVLIGLMLQVLMRRMNGSISPQEIVRRVTAQGNAAGIRLGEFKDLMVNMLSSNSQDLFLNQVMNNIIRADLAGLHCTKVSMMVILTLACVNSPFRTPMLTP